MQQIADWLEKLGMSEYASRFAENRIDFSVLPDLTDQHLNDLQLPLGDRLKMLRAIRELSGAIPQSPKTASVEPESQSSVVRRDAAPVQVGARAANVAGERRYVTVMFCDLVGSTSISAQLDAEEWRDLVGSYLDAADEAVTEMGGHVAKKLGDGLMALFGYPVAQENDAERAVRAALSIQRALAELNGKNEGAGKPALAARIAIDTGPAVLDAGGEIFGDVPNRGLTKASMSSVQNVQPLQHHHQPSRHHRNSKLPRRRSYGCRRNDLGYRNGHQRRSFDLSCACPPEPARLGVPLSVRYLLPSAPIT